MSLMQSLPYTLNLLGFRLAFKVLFHCQIRVKVDLGIDYLDVCIDISSKLQFQVFFGECSISYGTNGIDVSAFKCTQSGIDKPRDRSFGSIYKWLERGFRINPETHVLTVQTLVKWQMKVSYGS